MEWFFHNALADMYGPYFLLLYAGVTGLVWIVCVTSLSKAGRSGYADAPIPTLPAQPDPYELAWLRDGERGALQLAAFRLVQLGLLQPAIKGKNALQLNPDAPKEQNLNDIERLLLNEAFATPQESAKVLRVYAPRVASLCSAYEQKAQTLELLTTDAQDALRGRLSLLGVGSILLLGGYKLFIALSRGKSNVLFLIVIAVAGVIVTRFLCRKQRLSPRGKEYLKRVSESLTFLKGRLEEDPSMAPLLVGVFGLGVLLGTPWGMAMAVRPGDSSSSSNDSSYSDSGSGGSGCGGGSGGGSGCGGCGGGGGD